MLFDAVRLGKLMLHNRIVVSPMCQYSAVDGNAGAWHTVHLAQLALSGAGLVFMEATAVAEEGRITPNCLGLYSPSNQSAIGETLRTVRSLSRTPIGIQLSYSGRKGSCQRPWDGGTPIALEQGGWALKAPSALPAREGAAVPDVLSRDDIGRIVDSFRVAGGRARALGLDCIELQMAHGYLLHQFLSPLSNHRKDEFGGSFENRIRVPLSVFKAVHAQAGEDIPVGVRVSATDWVSGGWDIEQTIELCKRLQAAGCAFVDVSSGGVSAAQKIPATPGYQVPFAQALKNALEIPVIAIGLITDPHQAEAIISEGKADLVALARAILHDPRWPWRAAAALGAKVAAPPQYQRCLPAGAPDIFLRAQGS